jgi:beta-alanine degradation protein BauB
MSTTVTRLAALTLLSLCPALAGYVHAQTVPRSYDASPDIYNVISQNEQFKLILVTFKPGQRDAPHSHPAGALYFVDDCSLRAIAPDGSSRVLYTKSGSGTVQAAVPGHTIENVGSRDCRLVMFEPS